MRESSSQVATVTAIVVLSVLTVIGASAPVGAGPSAASDTVTTAPTATAPIAAQQGSPECSFPVTVTDASGTDVSLREEPERIVVLAPSDAQTLWAIGARGNVVGMPTGQYTSYLNGTQGKTDVTNNDGSVNAEQVVGLQPDIVFAASVTPNETVAQLRGAGLTVYSTGLATSIEDVYGVTERYGRLTGNCEGANETVGEMRTRVNEIEEAIDESDRPPALYYFYNFTAGQGTHINDVLQAAGARNIAAQAGITGYERISAEIVASRNPEWIVHPADSPVPQGQPYSSTAALEANRTVALQTNLIQQPAPRIVYPLTRLARALHPEAMREANLSPIDFSSQAGAANATSANGTSGATESPIVADGGNETVRPTSTVGSGAGGAETTATATGNSETTASETGASTAGETGTTSGSQTTETSGPGFGPVGAIVAVLAAALLARVRN
jgi:iron complex transport system substrate-binding protein